MVGQKCHYWCNPRFNTASTIFLFFINDLDEETDASHQVRWWHKAGRSGWYPGVLCSPSEGPHQVGEMNRENSIKANAESMHQHRLEPTYCKAALWRETWRSWWVTSYLWPSITLVSKNDNDILGYIRRSIASISRELILHLHSTLMRPHLKYCVHFQAPQYQRNMEVLEQVQWRATKIIKIPSWGSWAGSAWSRDDLGKEDLNIGG